MKVLELARELKNSGWPDNKKLLILAARYYLGLETIETLRINARLSENKVNYILYSR
jgi:hypothetical protein